MQIHFWTITAAIQIDAGAPITNIVPASGPASGGTGFTITGTNLTGATSVSFSGVPATSINVVNSTTVTGVTPARNPGDVVDIVLTTPHGSGMLTNSYTYTTTSVGQSAFGGTIACMNGGINNLIAAVTDIGATQIWGSTGLSTSASSNTDGASNTTTIINTVGEMTPNASTVCGDFEVDSQGNTPCESGNTCYNDWFLPAGNNTTSSGQLNCLYVNQVSIGGFSPTLYWSSTESTLNAGYAQSFSSGVASTSLKSTTNNLRCVRAFTP